MDREKWVKECVELAKEYKKNLLNKNLLIIHKSKNNIEYLETKFYTHNFLHLTGLSYKGSANDFFTACLKNKLSSNDIYLNEKQSKYRTNLKLSALGMLLNIDKNSKIIGKYNFTKPKLKIDIAIGNINCCMGFDLDKNDNKYYPKSALSDNTNNLVNDSSTIIAIAKKNSSDKIYSNITYIHKKYNIFDLFNEETLDNVIDWENIYSNSNQFQDKIDSFHYKNNNFNKISKLSILYSKLNIDINENTIDSDLKCGSLEELNDKNGNTFFHYYDGNKEGIISIETGVVFLNDDDISNCLKNINYDLNEEEEDEEEW